MGGDARVSAGAEALRPELIESQIQMVFGPLDPARRGSPEAEFPLTTPPSTLGTHSDTPPWRIPPFSVSANSAGPIQSPELVLVGQEHSARHRIVQELGVDPLVDPLRPRSSEGSDPGRAEPGR